MPGWIGDIEQATLDNATFRTVLFTGEHAQLTMPEHPDGTVHRTKADAVAVEHH